MILRTLSRLLSIQGFALSMLMLTTLYWPAWAQTAVSDVPAQTSAPAVPAVSRTTNHLKKSFDHTQTGFALMGAHVSVSCETCHTGGTFKGTPKDCAGCHTAGRTIVALPKPLNHILTIRACDACHVDQASFKLSVMDHTGMTEPCSVCHNGRYSATIKSSPADFLHSSTSASCDTCHKNTSTFLGAAFDHSNATANCASCHNGVAAPGKPTAHIVTSAPCEACHTPAVTPGWPTPTSFLGATFDHTGISTNCASCHNGSVPGVMGKPTAHIPTTAACETCHSPTYTSVGGFTHWTMSHAGITSGCATCHASGLSFTNNGGTPLVTLNTSIHVPVGTTACELCHAPSGTSTGGFTSGWVMGAAGHALVSANSCATCHADSAPYTGVVKQNSIITHIPTTSTCDTCHTATNTNGYTTFLGATGTHTSNPVPSLGATCLVCHGGGTPGTVGTGGGKNMIVNHIPIGALDCSTCHSYTSFVLGSAAAAATPTHTAVTGTACATCHNAGLGYVGISGGTPVVTKPTSHIPTSAACNTCHTSLTAPGGFTTWTMSHAGITAGCATCHASGRSFTNNGGTPLVTLNTSIHVPIGTTACETCHSSSATTVGSFSTAWTMGITGHTAVLGATPLCATCHGTSGAVYTGVKIIDSAHIPSAYYPAEDCGVCHTASTTGNYSLGGFNLLVGAGLPMHTNILTGCAPCHNNVIAKGTASFVGHIAIGSTDCSNCHTPSNTSTYTTFLGATAGHTAPSAPGQCLNSGCHVAGGAGKVYTNPPHIPVPGIQCDVCHTTSYASLSFLAYDSTRIHAAVTGFACATCHNGSYTSQGTTGAETTTFISNHIPTLIIGAAVSTVSTCNTCHSGTTNWTTMTSTTAIHNGAQGGGPVYCVTCHLNAGTYMEPAGFQAKNHNSASTTKDCSSSGCHKPKGNEGSSYVTWSN